jgi:hypothetical protein
MPLPTAALTTSRALQQLRQLADVGGDAPN